MLVNMAATAPLLSGIDVPMLSGIDVPVLSRVDVAVSTTVKAGIQMGAYIANRLAEGGHGQGDGLVLLAADANAAATFA